MKFRFLAFLLPLILNATHTVDRKVYATDITNKSGTTVLRLPTALATASRVCSYNADAEITSSSVSTTTLGYLDATSSIQTQLDSKLPISAISNTAYDATSWNGNSDGATKDAIRDKFESLSGATPGGSDTFVQYNNASAFGGSSFLAVNETNKRVVVNAGNATASELLFLQGTTTGTTQASDGFKIGHVSAGSNTIEFNQRESSAGIQFKTTSLTNIDMSSTYTDIRGSGGYKIITDANGIGLNANTTSAVIVRGAGTFGWATKAVTGTNTLATSDSWLVSNDATSAAYTLNLATNGQQSARLTGLYKMDASNNSVTLDPPSTNTIIGALTTDLQSRGDGMLIYADANDGKHYILGESRAAKMQPITANTTLTADHREQFIECNATSAGGDVTVTAFATTGYRGWKVTVVNIGSANNCIFDANSSEQISEPSAGAYASANTSTVATGKSKTWVSNGTLWRKVAEVN